MQNFTDKERMVIDLLIQGHNLRTITEWTELDYKSLMKIKLSIYKKLKIKRSIQIIFVLFIYGYFSAN